MPIKQEDLTQVEAAIKNITVVPSSNSIIVKHLNNVEDIPLIMEQNIDWTEEDQSSINYVLNREKVSNTATNQFDIKTNTDGSLELMTQDGLKEIIRPTSYYSNKLHFEEFRVGMYYDLNSCVIYSEAIYITTTPLISNKAPNNSRLWKKVSNIDFVEKECTKFGDRLVGLITAYDSAYDSVHTIKDLWELYFYLDTLSSEIKPKELKKHISNTADNEFTVEQSIRDFTLHLESKYTNTVELTITPTEGALWEFNRPIVIRITIDGVTVYNLEYSRLDNTTDEDDNTVKHVKQTITKREDADGNLVTTAGENTVEETSLSAVTISYSNLNNAILSLDFPSKEDVANDAILNPSCTITGLKVQNK